MAIGGIDYASVFQNYRMPVIPSVTVNQVREQENAKQAAENAATAPVVTETPAVTRPERNDASLEDISITFNKSDDYGYIGRDSDIHTLDVEKAIDDMKKDKILQQYQYFVGRSANIGGNEDGTVIQK